jgi:hypothetical protein
MFLDSQKIKDFLFSRHPRFVELKDDENKIFYALPFEKHENAFLIINTGISNKYPKTSYLDIRFYDNEIHSYFGRKQIVKLDYEKEWEKKIKKSVTFIYKDLKPLTCSCGFYMVVKKNKNGNFFLSCSDYPTCNGIKNIDEINDFIL